MSDRLLSINVVRQRIADLLELANADDNDITYYNQAISLCEQYGLVNEFFQQEEADEEDVDVEMYDAENDYDAEVVVEGNDDIQFIRDYDADDNDRAKLRRIG